MINIQTPLRIFDTQNCIRILDELTKTQPQYAQSVTNLQQRTLFRIWFQFKRCQRVT